MKKLFGNDVDTIEVPGMEIDTVSKYGINIFQDFKPGDAPVKPEVAAVLARRGDHKPEALPLTYCLPGGIPLSTMLSEVSKIVQTPGLILIMLELGGTRQIYTDGRKHMADPSPSWLGYSVGRWEKDTLVVDTIGFNGKNWLDIIGHPQSEQAPRDGALPPPRLRPHGHRDHDRRPHVVHEAVHREGDARTAGGHRHPRVLLQRERAGPEADGALGRGKDGPRPSLGGAPYYGSRSTCPGLILSGSVNWSLFRSKIFM